MIVISVLDHARVTSFTSDRSLLFSWLSFFHDKQQLCSLPSTQVVFHALQIIVLSQSTMPLLQHRNLTKATKHYTSNTKSI